MTDASFRPQVHIEDPAAPDVPVDAPESGARQGLPFAARFQGILIVVMCLGLVLIAQQRSKDLYRIGLPLLVLAAFLQIAFGNIPARSGFVRSVLLLLLTWAIVGALFALSIYLAPELIDLSRSES